MLCIFLSVQDTSYGAVSVRETKGSDMNCPLSAGESATVTSVSSAVVTMKRDLNFSIVFLEYWILFLDCKYAKWNP